MALDEAPASVEFFLRDDDAGWADDRLLEMLAVIGGHALPIDLAVIPRAASSDLARQLSRLHAQSAGRLGLHQHGLAHHNHEPHGRKSSSAPRGRPTRSAAICSRAATCSNRYCRESRSLCSRRRGTGASRSPPSCSPTSGSRCCRGTWAMLRPRSRPDRAPGVGGLVLRPQRRAPAHLHRARRLGRSARGAGRAGRDQPASRGHGSRRARAARRAVRGPSRPRRGSLSAAARRSPRPREKDDAAASATLRIAAAHWHTKRARTFVNGGIVISVSRSVSVTGSRCASGTSGRSIPPTRS
jgi:hypothetical protein